MEKNVFKFSKKKSKIKKHKLVFEHVNEYNVKLMFFEMKI